MSTTSPHFCIQFFNGSVFFSRGPSEYSLFVGERGRVRSGIGLARLVQGGDPVSFVLSGMGRAGHHPHSLSRPVSIPLSLVSCLSRLLSLVCRASLVSCVTCSVSASLLSSLCAVLFVSFSPCVRLCACLCLSVRLSLLVSACVFLWGVSHESTFSEGGWLSVCVGGLCESYSYNFNFNVMIINNHPPTHSTHTHTTHTPTLHTHTDNPLCVWNGSSHPPADFCGKGRWTFKFEKSK